MKIGINTLFMIPGEVGGTETYLRQTLIEIAAQFPKHPLVLFTNNENHVTFERDLADFGHVTLAPLKFNAVNRAARIIREQTTLPDAAKRNGVKVLWSPGYTAPYGCACPQVVTIPDMQYKTHPQDLTRVARVVTDLLVNAAARRCQRIIALSEFSRGEILRFTAAQGDRVDVVPLAASPEFGAMLSLERRRELLAPLLPADRPYLLSVAASYPHKNLPALVRAFNAIQAAVPHTLALVGNDGLGEGALQEALRELPEPSRVVRLRKVPRAALIALYQGCDVFVFPSLYEGFGLPVLEAMTAGVPVVTTRYGSIPEVGGDAVAYFDPMTEGALAAGLLKTIRQPSDDRSRAINRGQELARRFSWAGTARQTVAALAKAAGVDL